MASVAPAQVSIPPSLIPIILDSPAASTPPGETPNFTDPPSLHVYLYVTLVLGLVLTTTILAARIYTKAFIIRSVGWDDYTIVLSWILFVGFCAEIFVCLPLVGIHMWNETVAEVFSMLYTANNVEIIYVPTILFVKISILLQYLRIFAPTRGSNAVMWWGLQFMIWSNVIFYTIEMFFDIFTCDPRALSWDQLLNGWCWDVNKILISVAVFNLVSDVIILLLPQYSIWRLHMPLRRKIGISAIFGLGLLACLVTALRVQSTVQLIQTQDASWYLGGLALWAIAEISLAIICSCLPTMPKLYQAIRRKLTARQSLSSGSRSSKFLSKGTSTSASSEKPARHAPSRWPRSLYSETDALERNEPIDQHNHQPEDPRTLPPSSQRYVAELDTHDRILRTYTIDVGVVTADSGRVQR